MIRNYLWPSADKYFGIGGLTWFNFNPSMDKGKTLMDINLVLTLTDPRSAMRPAEGPNSFHWKNVKLEVLSCCKKFHEPHVVSEYAYFLNNIIAMKALPSDTPIINI